MVFNNPISSMFGTSPIKPLQEHMSTVVDCASILDAFFAASYEGKWDKAGKLFEKLAEEEASADQMKKEFRMHMPKSLFMPVSRGDLLNILSLQDDIANISKDVAGIVLGREMDIPKSLQSSFSKFVQSAIQTCEKAKVAINELDELLETGFTGQEVKFVQKLIRELDAQEQKVDKHEKQIRHKLFKLESELPPVNVMFLYNVIDNVGSIADTAERIGNRLELLIAK